jgi:hypothetical protein
VRTARGGHRPGVVEQALDLALVQADAGDLALELVADLGVGRVDADVRRQSRQRARSELVERAEVVPQAVREVLVEHDHAGVVRPGHHPASWLVEQLDPDLAA